MSEIRELVLPALKQIEAELSGLKRDACSLTTMLDAQTRQLERTVERLDRILDRLEAATGLSRERVRQIRSRFALLREFS